MSKPREWQDMTDIFTKEGKAKLELGQVLTFNFEGSRNDYRIVEITDDKVWGKPITTYSPKEGDARLSDEGLEIHKTKSHDVE